MSEVALYTPVNFGAGTSPGAPNRQRFGVKNNYFTEMCSGSQAGSYLRLIDSCITQLKAQGPSRTCNESKEEEKKGLRR